VLRSAAQTGVIEYTKKQKNYKVPQGCPEPSGFWLNASRSVSCHIGRKKMALGNQKPNLELICNLLYDNRILYQGETQQ
jgi:hypothetical protein